MPFIRYLYLIILCLSSTSVLGQIEIGVKAGVTLGALLGDVDKTTSSGSPSIGPHGGIYTRIPISNKLYFQPELQYNNSGVTYNERLPRTDTLFPVITSVDTFFVPTFYTSDVEGEYRLHFIDLPLKFIYAIKPKMQLVLGPRISYLTRGTNVGRREIDVGAVAGTREDFDSEEAYLDALFTRSIEIFDEGGTLDKLNFGVVLGSYHELGERLSIYFDSSIDLTYIQKKTENIPYDFRSFYLSLGLSYQLSDFETNKK